MSACTVFIHPGWQLLHQVKSAGEELPNELHQKVFENHIPSGIIKYFNTLEITHNNLEGVQRIHVFPFHFKQPNMPEMFHGKNPLDVVAVMSSDCAKESDFQLEVHGVEYAQVLLFFTMNINTGGENRNKKAAFIKYFDTFADSKGEGMELKAGIPTLINLSITEYD